MQRCVSSSQLSGAVAVRPLPAPPAMEELFKTLLNKTVTITKLHMPLSLIGPPARAVATWVAAPDTVVYVAVMEIAFVAALGSGLGMFPKSVVEEAIKTGAPSAIVLENAQEVLSVVSSLFNDDASIVHVNVGPIMLKPPPAEFRKWITRPKARTDLNVTLAGYPPGKFALLHVRGVEGAPAVRPRV